MLGRSDIEAALIKYFGKLIRQENDTYYFKNVTVKLDLERNLIMINSKTIKRCKSCGLRISKGTRCGNCIRNNRGRD